MKNKQRPVLLLILILLLPAVRIFSAGVTIVQLSGKVEIKLPTENTWQPAVLGMEIPINSDISTGFRSFAILDLESSEIKVMALTRMKVDKIIDSQEGVTTSLLLGAGKIRADVKTTETRTHDFTITSPIATAAVRGTSFIFNGYSLQVIQGMVLYVNTIGEQISVPMGTASKTTGTTTPAEPIQVVVEETTVSTTPAAAEEETEEPPLTTGDDIGLPPTEGISINLEVE